MKKVINIAKDFNKSPEGRLREYGVFSAQKFREEFLVPAFKDSNISKIEVVLDGLDGVASSFWEEAFGGLIYREEILLNDVENKLSFICTDDVTLIPLIEKYIKKYRTLSDVIKYGKKEVLDLYDKTIYSLGDIKIIFHHITSNFEEDYNEKNNVFTKVKVVINNETLPLMKDEVKFLHKVRKENTKYLKNSDLLKNYIDISNNDKLEEAVNLLYEISKLPNFDDAIKDTVEELKDIKDYYLYYSKPRKVEKKEDTYLLNTTFEIKEDNRYTIKNVNVEIRESKPLPYEPDYE